MKTIRCITDKKTGKITIETIGYGGASCLSDPRVNKLEAGLGLDRAESTPTAEAFEEEKQQQKLEGT